MEQDQDNSLPGLIDVSEEQLASPTRPHREKVRRQALGDKGPLLADPSRCDVLDGNTRDTTAVAQDVDSELKAAIEQVGQQVAVIARISPHDPERFTVHRRSTQRLLTIGELDPLTNLPTRRSFQMRVKSAALRGLESGSSFGLLLMDLDRLSTSTTRLVMVPAITCFVPSSGACGEA